MCSSSTATEISACHARIISVSCILFLLHKFLPSLFAFLASSSPVIACAFLLLGILLINGDSNLRRDGKEDGESTRAISKLHLSGARESKAPAGSSRLGEDGEEVDANVVDSASVDLNHCSVDDNDDDDGSGKKKDEVKEGKENATAKFEDSSDSCSTPSCSDTKSDLVFSDAKSELVFSDAKSVEEEIDHFLVASAASVPNELDRQFNSDQNSAEGDFQEEEEEEEEDDDDDDDNLLVASAASSPNELDRQFDSDQNSAGGDFEDDEEEDDDELDRQFDADQNSAGDFEDDEEEEDDDNEDELFCDPEEDDDDDEDELFCDPEEDDDDDEDELFCDPEEDDDDDEDELFCDPEKEDDDEFYDQEEEEDANESEVHFTSDDQRILMALGRSEHERNRWLEEHLLSWRRERQQEENDGESPSFGRCLTSHERTPFSDPAENGMSKSDAEQQHSTSDRSAVNAARDGSRPSQRCRLERNRGRRGGSDQGQEACSSRLGWFAPQSMAAVEEMESGTKEIPVIEELDVIGDEARRMREDFCSPGPRVDSSTKKTLSIKKHLLRYKHNLSAEIGSEKEES